MLQQLKIVLDCLPQPAFVRDDMQICLMNPAAASLELQHDAQQLFAQLPPVDSDGCHCLFTYRDSAWDAAIRPVAGLQLVILQLQREPEPQLLAAAARALREPLQRMLVASKKLWPRLEEQEDEKLQAETAAINHGMHQLLRAIGNLSDLDPGQRKMLQFQKRTSCPDFLAAFAQRVEPLVAATGRQFVLRCQERHFYALMDVQSVERALLNLIANAIAHSPADSCITLRAFAEAGRCCFAVENTGAHIGEAALAGMVQPWTREETVLPSSGAGFGLQIARNVAQAHAGSLLICPQPKGGLRVVLSVAEAELRFGERPVHSPMQFDRTGGFDRYLVELSDVLEDKWFDTRKID